MARFEKMLEQRTLGAKDLAFFSEYFLPPTKLPQSGLKLPDASNGELGPIWMRPPNLVHLHVQSLLASLNAMELSADNYRAEFSQIETLLDQAVEAYATSILADKLRAYCERGQIDSLFNKQWLQDVQVKDKKVYFTCQIPQLGAQKNTQFAEMISILQDKQLAAEFQKIGWSVVWVWRFPAQRGALHHPAGNALSTLEYNMAWNRVNHEATLEAVPMDVNRLDACLEVIHQYQAQPSQANFEAMQAKINADREIKTSLSTHYLKINKALTAVFATYSTMAKLKYVNLLKEGSLTTLACETLITTAVAELQFFEANSVNTRRCAYQIYSALRKNQRASRQLLADSRNQPSHPMSILVELSR